MTRIRLDAITFDAGTQIRAAIDQQVVSDYAEQMTDGAVFPPIVLFHDGNQHYLADGFHRFMAAQRNAFKDIDADVRAGTHDDALWFALGANKTNGKRLNETDKRHALELGFKTWPHRSANQMAEQVGCTHVYAAKIREQVVTSYNLPDRVTGKDGKSYPATESARHPKRDAVAALVKAGKSSAEIQEATRAHGSFIAKVRRELGVGRPETSKDIRRARREQIRTMAAEGYSSRQMAAAVGVGEQVVKEIIKQDGIDVPADRVVGKARLHDANRIIEQIVADAENLTAGVNLINFNTIDRDRLGEWVDSLIASKKALGTFINRLIKEREKHGEAA